MNKQGKIVNGKVVGGIEWTKTVLPDGTEQRGYTWNPIGGCAHACRWIMPRKDGKEVIAECYAENVAEGVAGKAYPQGFAHHYWHPELLNKPFNQKTPSRIFMGSMADWMGTWVPDDHITQVIAAMNKANWHTFQALTKNAPRLLKWIGKFPANLWVGASTPPDFMFGKRLTYQQQYRMLRKTLEVFVAIKKEQPEVKVWLSAEPLSWDISSLLVDYAVDWMVIGAASNGRDYYSPDEMDVRDTVSQAEYAGTKIFFKGNLKSLKWAADNWRENYP